MGSESESEQFVGQPQPRRGFRAGLLVGVAGMAALMGTMFGAAKWGVSSTLNGSQGKEERIVIEPSFPACATGKENCINIGCCQVSGHKCFTKKGRNAQCNETCTPGVMGFTCAVVDWHSVPVQSKLGQRLFCFSVYTKNHGGPKKSTELELLTLQNQHGASIFACDQWDVFADVAVPIGQSGYTTIQVQDQFGEFHRVKRKTTQKWVNWGMFYQVWVKVRDMGKWAMADYTVKVDADAVFVPQRLRDYMAARGGDSPNGFYLENCKNVQYGFFGNLEVISKTGARLLTQSLDECHAVFAPCADKGCDWKLGPWGEDVFVQRCMDHHLVDKVEAFNLTTDGMCEADRPAYEKKNKKWHAPDCSTLTSVAAHPYKKPQEYMKCLGEMTGQTYSA